MRTDAAKPVRLADYRPSDYLVDRVDLDFHLDPTATSVISRLSIRQNPAGRSAAALMLDGDGVKLKRIEIDGKTAGPAEFTASPDQLVLHTPPQRP